MNYLELCQKVFDEADRAPYKIETVAASGERDEQVYKIISWVAQAYHDIQRWSQNLKFHYQDGVLFTTTVGETTYTVDGVREIYRDSVYANRVSAPNGKWELTYLTQKQWRDIFKLTNLTNSLPVYFIEQPDGRFRVEPPSSEACEIRAAWSRRLYSLVNDEDEPVFHEDYHMAIVYQALIYYASEFEVPEELATRIRLTLPKLRAAFLIEYEPSLEVFS